MGKHEFLLQGATIDYRLDKPNKFAVVLASGTRLLFRSDKLKDRVAWLKVFNRAVDKDPEVFDIDTVIGQLSDSYTKNGYASSTVATADKTAAARRSERSKKRKKKKGASSANTTT